MAQFGETGFFDCFGDVPVCCGYCWCGCCMEGYTRSLIDGTEGFLNPYCLLTCCGFGFVSMYLNRQDAATKFGYEPGSPVVDLILACCLPCCFGPQTYLEAKKKAAGKAGGAPAAQEITK